MLRFGLGAVMLCLVLAGLGFSSAAYNIAARCAQETADFNAMNTDPDLDLFCFAGFCGTKAQSLSWDLYSPAYCSKENRWCIFLVLKYDTEFGPLLSLSAFEFCGPSGSKSFGAACTGGSQCQSGRCTGGVCDCAAPSWGGGTGSCPAGTQCKDVAGLGTLNKCVQDNLPVGTACDRPGQCALGVCGDDKKCRCRGLCAGFNFLTGQATGCNGCGPGFQCIEYNDNNNICAKYPVPPGGDCNLSGQCQGTAKTSGSCYANGFQVCECVASTQCPAGQQCVRPAANTPRKCVSINAKVATNATTTVVRVSQPVEAKDNTSSDSVVAPIIADLQAAKAKRQREIVHYQMRSSH